MGSVKYAERVREHNPLYSHYSYAIVDGEQFFDHGCYGSIHEEAEDNGTGVQELSVYHIPNPNFSQSAYGFVMSPEMFGTAFLDTSLENGLEKGWDLDTSKPYQFVLGAMIALRFAFNITKYTNSYQAFTDNGATSSEAFFLCQSFGTCFLDNRIYTTGFQSDHIPLTRGINPQDWIKNPSPTLTTSVPTSEQAWFDWSYSDEIRVNSVWHMWEKGDFSKYNILNSPKFEKRVEEVFGRRSEKTVCSPKNIKTIIEWLRTGEVK